MPQEKMSQDEVDALVKKVRSSNPEDEDPDEDLARKVKVTKYYKLLRSAEQRLMAAREYGTFEEAKFAEYAVHKTAFRLWCINRSIEPDEYYRIMNEEAIKKGLKPVFRLKS